MYYVIKSNFTCLCLVIITNNQGLDFDDMSSIFPCEIDDATQYIILGYGA